MSMPAELKKYIEMEAKPDKVFLYTEGPVLNEQ